MSYNTGNSAPSNDARDLSDNVENIDAWANSLESTHTDRLGVPRSTLEGVRQGLGFYNVGTFDAGATLTNTRQVLTSSDGREYGWGGAFPKIVAAGSSPTPLGAGGWVDRSGVTLREELAEAGSTVLISGVEAGVVAGAANALKNSLAAPSSTVSIAGLEAGKVKDAANNVRAVTIITGAGTQYVTAAQIGRSLLFAAATAVIMPTIESLGGVTGHYRIMTMDNPVALTRIDGSNFYTRGGSVSSITIPAWSDCYVAYSAGSGVYVYGLATYETIKKSYCLVNALGTGAPNELVSAALPANITINTRYVLTNPFGANVPVICWVEIFANGVWSDPGYIYDTGSSKGTGVAANYVQGSGIVIQTGGMALMTTSSALSGGGHGATGLTVTSAPCRVFIQKLGA